MNKRTTTIYICYLGLNAPLVQTQVLPYVKEMTKLDNLKVSLLTFEPEFNKNWNEEKIEIEKQKLKEQNINWYCLPYSKSPRTLGTFYDIVRGAKFLISLSRREKIDVLHNRVHIPLLMTLMANRFTKSKIVFDIRGLLAEEYVEAGILREGSKVFRAIKSVEAKGLEKASQVIVLTEKMRDYLIKNKLKDSSKIEVIPCCVDSSRISQASDDLPKNDRFTMIYAGSVVGLYLLREMGMFFQLIKKHKPDAFFQILTASPPEFVEETFKEIGLTEEDFAINKVLPEEVPGYVKKAHLGISFRSPTFSQIAASPTKVPEYLACGIPVVSNDGIGDTDFILKKEKVGVSLKNFELKEMNKKTAEILKLLNEDKIFERCISAANNYFDLTEVGGKRYRKVYKRLMSAD